MTQEKLSELTQKELDRKLFEALCDEDLPTARQIIQEGGDLVQSLIWMQQLARKADREEEREVYVEYK